MAGVTARDFSLDTLNPMTGYWMTWHSREKQE